MVVDQALVNAKVQDMLEQLNAAIILVNDGSDKIHQHEKVDIAVETAGVTTKNDELTILLAA